MSLEGEKQGQLKKWRKINQWLLIQMSGLQNEQKSLQSKNTAQDSDFKTSNNAWSTSRNM